MALFDRVFFARILLTATLASLIATGVVFINPINEYSSVTNGTCEIIEVFWTQLWCEGSFKEYYVPVITANFRNASYFGYNDTSIYTGLYINKNHVSDIQATIFDDGTDDALVQCEWPGIQAEIISQLVDQIPELNNFTEFDYLNETILDDLELEWVPCYHSHDDDLLYLNSKKPNYYLAAIFGISLYCHLGVSIVVAEVAKENSGLLLIANIGVGIAYSLHMVLYAVLLILCIMLVIVCNGKMTIPDAGKLFKQGSIFLPVISITRAWLQLDSDTSSTPEHPVVAQNIVEESASVIIPQPQERAIQRSLSEPTLGPSSFVSVENIEPEAPSPQGNICPSDLSAWSGVINAAPPDYWNLVIENQGAAESIPVSPPSYDEIMNGASTRV